MSKPGILASRRRGPVAIVDDFNRADGGLGAAWVNLSGSASIVSNEARCSSPTEISARHLTPLNSDDQYAQIEYLGLPAAYSFPLVNVFVRLQSDGSESGYQLLVPSTEGSASTRRIAKVVNGVQTNLISQSVKSTPPFTVRLEVAGTTLTAFINGAQVMQVTDTTFSSGPYVGFGGPGGLVRVDNFAAGDL